MNLSKNIRKILSLSKTKTLESKSAPLHPSFLLNTLLLHDLEVVDERQVYPCTTIGILLKSRKNYMLVPVPVSVVPVPQKLQWYRYQKATGDFLLWGTGTGLLGTGTTASANAPPHHSSSQDFSTAAAISHNDLYSLFGHEPL